MPGQPMPQGQAMAQPAQPQKNPNAGKPQSVEQMVSVIGTTLRDFSGLLQKAQGQIPPEFAQRAQALQQGFESLIQDLSTGGAQAAPKQVAMKQPVPSEAGSQGVPRL